MAGKYHNETLKTGNEGDPEPRPLTTNFRFEWVRLDFNR